MSWLIRFILVIAGMGVMFKAMDNPTVTKDRFIIYAGLIVTIYAVFFVHLPRMRSLGMHGALFLITGIPIINIAFVMMLALGSEGYWTRLLKRQKAG